jgi:hypothetical protein
MRRYAHTVVEAQERAVAVASDLLTISGGLSEASDCSETLILLVGPAGFEPATT